MSPKYGVKNDITQKEAPLLGGIGHASYGLCHRCEWRARYYETGHGPRCECSDRGHMRPSLPGDNARYIPSMSCGCYMYMPVMPAVLTVADGDRRSYTTIPMLRARMRRDAGATPDCTQVAHESGRKGHQHFVYWLPKSLLPVLQKYWARLERAARKGK